MLILEGARLKLHQFSEYGVDGGVDGPEGEAVPVGGPGSDQKFFDSNLQSAA